MRADVINIEHGPRVLIAVGVHPGGHGSVHIIQLVIAAAKDTAGHGDGRKGAEADVLRVGIAALDGFLHLDVHVGFLVLAVQEQGAAQTGIVGNQALILRLGQKGLPGKALVLVAGQDHPHTGGVTLGNGFDVDVVGHVFFLSQPLSGCVQKPHPMGRNVCQRAKRFFAGLQIAVQPFPVVIDQQNLPDVRQTEAHFLQGVDPVNSWQLFLAVITVAGEVVHFFGGQQADFIIVAQHADTDSG